MPSARLLSVTGLVTAAKAAPSSRPSKTRLPAGVKLSLPVKVIVALRSRVGVGRVLVIVVSGVTLSNWRLWRLAGLV